MTDEQYRSWLGSEIKYDPVKYLSFLRTPSSTSTSTITGLAGSSVKSGDVVYRASDGKFRTYLGFDLNNNTNNQQNGDNAMNTKKKVVCECEVVEEVPEFLSANISPTANGFKLTVHDTKFNNEEYSYESLASALAGLGHAIEEFDQEQGEEG